MLVIDAALVLVMDVVLVLVIDVVSSLSAGNRCSQGGSSLSQANGGRGRGALVCEEWEYCKYGEELMKKG